MAKLFYKDLKAHEKAYRNQRADEAGNDLILGAKVNAYNGFTEASNKSVNEIATNYANFLKELQVKELDLKNKSTMEENTLEKNAKEGKFLYMTPKEVRENVLMSLEDKPRRSLLRAPKKKLLLSAPKQTLQLPAPEQTNVLMPPPLALTPFGSKKSGSPKKSNAGRPPKN